MKKHRARSILTTVMIAILLLPMIPANVGAADSKVKDLILLQNVPVVDAAVQGESLELTALHIYEDGHFEQVASDDLTWSTSNKTVASVTNGEVALNDKPGRTFISVSDGSFEDRIAVHVKPSGTEVIKQDGDRYEIIDQAIEAMTIEEKVGQMLMPDFRKWEGENVTEMLPEIEQIVKDYHLGGVILFRENVVTTEQTAKLVAAYQQAAEQYGLLMTIDQEGGIVTRLQSGTDMPGNMALGATRSEETAYQVGHAIGEELNALGINMNLAPVLDVNNNPDNPVIGVRSFGESPELVANLGVSYIKGLQDSGTAATAKHFPGHGDTAVDSHVGLPEVPYGLERLMEVELYPFQQAMDAGIDAVMTAHVTFPKIDDTKVVSKYDGSEVTLPATLSPKVLTGLMREKMGFDGVIITDALNMGAITKHFGTVDAVIRTVKAGTDIILMPVGLEDVVKGLHAAIDSGEISVDRIEQSVERILTLKLNRGIIKAEQPKSVGEIVAEAKEVVGSEEHKQVEQKAARQSITLVKNNDVLPLQTDGKVVVVGNSFVEDLYESVKAQHPNAEILVASGPLSAEQLSSLAEAEAVIAGTYTYNVSTRSPSHPQMKLVNQLITELEVPVIGVGIRNPYDIMAYPEVDGYLAQYGFRTASFDATAATIFGEHAPGGQLPVTIPGLYEFGHGLTY